MPMDPATKALLLLIFAYLIGSIPFGYLVAWAYGDIDIREHGSGNIGATNVWRTLGALPGAITLLFDFSKGLLPVTASLWLVGLDEFGNNGFLWSSVICLVGLGAILGHAFPVWFQFKGGKIVATGLGVMVAIAGQWMLIPVGVFLVMLALTRYVSMASICGAITVPVIFLVGASTEHKVFPESDPAGNRTFLVFAILVGIFLVVKHASNIKRLLNGTEPRLGQKKPGVNPTLSTPPEAHHG